MIAEATVLNRPVGQKEFDLIAASGFRQFPPCLSWQRIFYPVLNEEYATQIARDWNTNDALSGFVGYVLRFRVRTAFLESFTVHTVGSRIAQEYWIRAEELPAFNENIVGMIESVARFAREKT